MRSNKRHQSVHGDVFEQGHPVDGSYALATFGVSANFKTSKVDLREPDGLSQHNAFGRN